MVLVYLKCDSSDIHLNSSMEAGLVRAGMLRHFIPVGEAVLRSAFEGMLS